MGDINAVAGVPRAAVVSIVFHPRVAPVNQHMHGLVSRRGRERVGKSSFSGAKFNETEGRLEEP